MESDEPGTVQEQIGRMAAMVMDFAEAQELTKLTLGGVALAGETELGTPLVLTRTTARDPFACINLWAAAIELESEAARRDTRDALKRAKERVAELESRLEDAGFDPS